MKKELFQARDRGTSNAARQLRSLATELWLARVRPVMDPDNIPEIHDYDRALLLTARDRIDEVLNADRNAKEGKRAA